MADDKVKEFYEQVVKPNGYFADEQEFRTVVSDPNKSKEFFDNALKAEGIFNDYSEFETVLGAGLKKNTLPNESTTPSEQPTTPSATSTSESKKVTTEFGEPAVMLEEVEIKPKPEIGYLQSFMEGIESYDDLQVGYDVLRSGDKAKIIDYYNTRYNNSLSQTPNDNFIKNALRIIGGTVPMMGKVATGGAVGGAIGSTIPVVGTAVGAASGTIAEGIYEGQKLSKSSAFEEAYFEAKSQNKTDDEAFEIANNVSKVAQIAGGVEGGISGLAGGTATKAGTSVLKNLAKEIIADATVGATAAGARRGTENIAAQQQGLERKTTAGIGEEMTGEAAFSFGLGLLLSPITQGKNLIGNRRKKIITAVAATDAPKAITTIDKAVEKGEVSQEDADALKVEIVQTAKAFEATPESMPYEEREVLTPVIAERQKLQKEFEKVSPATQPIVQAKIELIDKSIPIPLPPKYMDTAGQNTSELKDGQLYITRKGDVRMWDAAQKQFLEPPKSFEVEAKKETEQVKPTEEVAPQPKPATQQPATETEQAEAEVAPKSDALKDVESTAKALEGVEKTKTEKLSNIIGETLNKKKAKIDVENNSAITNDGKQIKFRVSKISDTEIGQDFVIITAIDNDGKKLGYAKFIDRGNGNIEGSEVEVSPKNQKQGIASAIYSFADAKGYNVKESVLQTPEGKALWESLKRKQGNIQQISSAYHSAKAKPESERTAQETKLITQVEQLLTPTPQTPVAGAEVNPALANVESTAKALEGVDVEFDIKRRNINTTEGLIEAERTDDVVSKIGFTKKPTAKNYALQEAVKNLSKNVRIQKSDGGLGGNIDVIRYDDLMSFKENPSKAISEAYHKAKADGSNPELVKAVEELLAPESQAKPLQTEAESKVATLPTAEIDQVDAEIGSKTYKQKLETYPKGRTREKTLPDGTKLKGTFKIVSADDVIASHNEQTFAKTEGFPTNEKGKTVNDRDYETDKAAQSEVVRIASNLDERAISQTPIVTKDGIVVDGNNRTMSRKLAAKQGTDKAYLDALKADADMYGIDPSEIDGVKNPMLVFEAEQKIPYTTKEFARFNKAEKKEKSPVEKAVELSKTISDRARRILGGIYEGAATPSEVTSNKKSMSEIRDLLISEGILQQNELPRYINPETGTATKEGVSFLETLLIGTSLDENTIRMLDNEGMGNAREKVLKAVVQITQNAALGENSLQSNIENGVKLLNKAKQSNQSVVDAVSQMDMFEVSAFTSEDLAVAILLDGSGFKDFLKRYNSEVGTESLFEGTLTKEKIIDTLLSQKIKNYEQVRKNLRADAKQGEGAVSKVDGGDSGKAEPNIFDQYDNTKGASKKDKVIEQYAKESGKDKADRVRDIIDNFDAIKSRLQELISEGKIDNIEIRC